MNLLSDGAPSGSVVGRVKSLSVRGPRSLGVLATWPRNVAVCIWFLASGWLACAASLIGSRRRGQGPSRKAGRRPPRRAQRLARDARGRKAADESGDARADRGGEAESGSTVEFSTVPGVATGREPWKAQRVRQEPAGGSSGLDGRPGSRASGGLRSGSSGRQPIARSGEVARLDQGWNIEGGVAIAGVVPGKALGIGKSYLGSCQPHHSPRSPVPTQGFAVRTAAFESAHVDQGEASRRKELRAVGIARCGRSRCERERRRGKAELPIRRCG